MVEKITKLYDNWKKKVHKCAASFKVMHEYKESQQ